MIPKTKIEIAVYNLSKNLPLLTDKQTSSAEKKFFEKLCYATKNHGFCLECGSDVNTSHIQNDKVTCVICNSKLKVVKTRKQSFATNCFYLGVTSLIKDGIYDFQLSRVFEFKKFHQKGERAVLMVREICQNWHEAKGKRVINARMINAYNGNYYGSLEIRKVRQIGYGYYKTYNPAPHIYCPTSKFRPEFVKKGISSKIKGVDLEFLVQYIENPKIETLLKAGYFGVIDCWGKDTIEKYWDTLKICLRNKYKIKDADMYKDYLDALLFLGKDMRNFHFVCPANFRKAHDYFIDKKCEKEIGREMKKVQDLNPKYLQEKKSFLNLLFTDNQITIQPLQDVHDFLSEGVYLKHCVFKSGYYKYKDSLVLSARIKGKPIETIEVCLKKFKVKQCHGLGNKDSKYHSKILSLINSNIPQIKKVAEKQRKVA